MAVEKRVRFKSWWLPWALVAPQMVVIIVFFFWPAGQALYYSVLQQDAFGTSVEFVGLENFKALFDDTSYLASFKTTACSRCWSQRSGLAISLLLAVMADRVVKGARWYKTLLDLALRRGAGGGWCAVAVHVRAVGRRGQLRAARDRHRVEPPARRHRRDDPDRADAAVWKQISYNFLFFLAGLQSIPKSLIEAAAIDGAGPWRRFWTVQFPLLSPTTFFLLVINIIYAFFDTFAIIDAATEGGPGQGHRDPGLQGVLRRLQGARPRRLGARSVVLMAIVIALTVVQFRYVEKTRALLTGPAP